jgi:hypothetical protein
MLRDQSPIRQSDPHHAEGDVFDFLKSEIGKIGGKVKDAAARLEAARREREHLMTAPLHPDDVVALLSELLDNQAEAYRREALPRAMEWIARERHLPLVAAGAFFEERDLPAVLSFALRDSLKKAVRDTAAKMDASHSAPPTAERVRRLAELETEIPAIEADLRQLVAGAREAGIVLPEAAGLLRPAKEATHATYV